MTTIGRNESPANLGPIFPSSSINLVEGEVVPLVVEKRESVPRWFSYPALLLASSSCASGEAINWGIWR